jgi:hypothetical protein
MRHGLTLVLLMCGAAPLGCFSSQPSRSVSQYGRPSTFLGPTGADVVQVRVALLERPVGDHAINQEIWQLADEQSVDLEHKVALRDNGFRMGQFGSSPPGSLLDLIRSERSCINPECINMRAGNPRLVRLGPVQSHCAFQQIRSGECIPVEMDRVQCHLQVTPTLTREGTTRLEFVPVLKYGQPTMTPQPIQEPGGTLNWRIEMHQPTTSYPQLSWHQTVSDSDYIVIGTWLDRPGTLGQRCFVETETPPPLQRLLVLRALRAGHEPLAPEDWLSKSSSIAAQAGLTARGTPP